MKPVMWSFGMQSRPLFHVGDHPDIGGVVKAAKKAGIKDAVIFGKDHTGLCFHPTRYGVQHPNTKINLTGNFTAALHKEGMRAIAYFNLGLDGEMGRKHPDWLQEKAPGNTFVTEDHYAWICVFSDYFRKYTIPVIMEMFDDYQIDGVFLDTMNAFGYCCCPQCKAAFQKATGRPLPLPAEKDNPDWDLYGPWQYQRMHDFMQELRDTIHAKYPHAEIIFNHIGGPSFPYPLPGIENEIVSCDPAAVYPWVSLFSSYLSALKCGGDIFIERFTCGWLDRNELDNKTMAYKCAAIFAHRQRFCVGDRMHPDARFADGSAHAMQIISNVWKKFNRALPDRLTRTDDFIFLLPESYRAGNNRKQYGKPDPEAAYRWPMLGTFRYLQDSGYAFMTVPEFALKRNLTQNKTVILTGAEALRTESYALLEEFVRKGGKLLICGTVPHLEDDSLPEFCGIKSAKKSHHICVYLPGKTKEKKILVCGDVMELELATAKPLEYGYSQQYASGLGATPLPYYNAAMDEKMDLPLLTVNRYGKGKVYFLNCNLMADYANSALVAQRLWGNELFRKYLPMPEAYLDNPAGNVELVAYEDKKKNEKVFVLVNHGGRVGSLRIMFVGEHITDPQPIFKLNLMVKSDADVTVTEGDHELSAAVKGKYISIPVIMDSTWKFIRIKKNK